MAIWDRFRRGRTEESTQNEIISELNKISEHNNSNIESIREVNISEDNSDSMMFDGNIVSIQESYNSRSPESLSSLIDTNEIKTEQLLNMLKAGYNLDETFNENEEMSHDSVVGSAIDIMADDACQVDEKRGTIVSVNSDDENLKRFLQDFLENNVNIEDRIWEWAFEVIKHGDFKLRRRVYGVKKKVYSDVESENSKETITKNVYYENVINPYKVTRIEYMGKVLGFSDADFDESKTTFENADEFVHFMSPKSSKREKVKIRVKSEDGESIEDLTCYKVYGTSIIDNARYMYRIVNLLDNMLIMSRVARSTQYNLVKVEVGNASPSKTQSMINDVRRRLEGSTRMKKNTGMRTDPSPIPVNSNVYIPTREGKGDITIESVNESVDVRSITDIDYFRDKEFATLKVPKQYVGFDEQMPGSLGNSSLVKLDTRYARTVKRIQTILRYGIEDLCNNYLRFRDRNEDCGKFDIYLRPLSTAETSERIEEHITSMQVFDSVNGLLETYGEYIDKAKLFKSLCGLVNIQPSEIASEKYSEILKKMETGEYKESDYKGSSEEDGEDEENW